MSPDDLFHPSPDATDAPRAGFYQLDLRGRPPIPVAIWYGPPADPDTGEILDRSWRWQMRAAGKPVVALEEEREDVWDPVWADVWPKCSASPIARGRYDYLIAEIDFARDHDPDSAFAQPFRKIDHRTVSLPF